MPVIEFQCSVMWSAKNLGSSVQPSPSRLPEAVADPDRKDRKKAGIAQVAIVTHFERREVLLKAGILIDRLASDRRRVVRIAGASREGDLQARLAHIVKTQLNRDAEVAPVSWNEIAEAKADARRDLAKVDTSGAMERIGIAADIVLAVQSDSAARWDNGSREDTVVIAEDELRTEAQMSSEGEPVQSNVASAEMEIHTNVCTFFLKVGAVVEEVRTRTQVESGSERCGKVKASPAKAGAGRHA